MSRKKCAYHPNENDLRFHNKTDELCPKNLKTENFFYMHSIQNSDRLNSLTIICKERKTEAVEIILSQSVANWHPRFNSRETPLSPTASQQTLPPSSIVPPNVPRGPRGMWKRFILNLYSSKLQLSLSFSFVSLLPLMSPRSPLHC